jgi:hypothetical protein
VLDLQQFYSPQTKNLGPSPGKSTGSSGSASTNNAGSTQPGQQHQPYRPVADPTLVDYVVAVLRDKQFRSLTELNVNNLNLSLTPIAQALAKNRTLRNISMLNNNFTTDELLQLLNVLLESNFTLTKLQLVDESSLLTESTAIEKLFSANEAAQQRQKQKQLLLLQSVLQRFNEEIQEVRFI